MSVTVSAQMSLTIAEVLTTNVPFADGASGKTLTDKIALAWSSLGASSTPPCTMKAFGQKALSGGAATIDLTAVSGANGVVQDLTGLKVQFAIFRNPSTNANPIVITFGAANPYLLGGTGWKETLQPGGVIMVFGNDATPDVAAGAKDIDLSGTGAQALDFLIAAG